MAIFARPYGAMGRAESLNTIDLIRFWAIFCMMYAHYRIDSLSEFGSLSHPDGVLYQAFHFGLSRTSSAFLGITSGYFVYHQICKHRFFGTLEKRFRSLVVPAIYWSAVFLLVTSVASVLANSRLPPEFSNDFWKLLNKFLPIQYWPANFPLHYLTDLFKLCLVAPILMVIVDNLSARWKIFLIALLVLFPNSVNDPGNLESVLPRWDLVIFFVAGLAIASEKLDLTALLRRRIPLTLLVTSLALVLALAPFWEQLMKSDDFRDQYIGYLMIMTIKTAGIVLFAGAAQRCISFPFVACLTPDRETIFTAFCLHAIILYFIARIAAKMDGILGTASAVSFLAFLLFPVLAFVGALALKRFKGMARATMNIRKRSWGAQRGDP